MNRALNIAATGMDAQQTKLDVTANNIANVSTPGFKKSRVEFEDLMYQMNRDTMQTQVGAGVRTAGSERLHSQGSISQTGKPLDIAVEGDGFFQLTLPSGETAYTRNGEFTQDNNGRIVNTNGFALQGELTIPPDTSQIVIDGNGVVTAVTASDVTPVEIGRIELATFVNPSGLLSKGHNVYVESAESGQAIVGNPGENGTGTLQQGLLELSNVKVVEEMVDLISGQRAYEVNARVIRAADEMLQQASNLR
jgi:flagellar basal-body rod protein FlgG